MKIYINIPSEVNRQFILEGRSLDTILKKQGLVVTKEELAIEGEARTREIFTTIVITAGTYIAMKIVDKVIDEILDKAKEKILKKLEKNKKDDEKIVVNIFLLQQDEAGKKHKIPIQELDNQELQLTDPELLFEVKKELMNPK